MRPNLSFDTFAAALTALGASALVACAGNEPKPVTANEVTAPAAQSGHAQASCSADGCGGSATTAAATPAAPAAPAAAPAATPPPTAPQTQAAAPAPAPAPTPAPSSPAAAATPPAKTAAKPAPKKAAPKPSNAEASCGAGTCAGDTTKKIL